MLYRIILSLLMAGLCWAMLGISQVGNAFGSFTKPVSHNDLGSQTLIVIISFAILAIWVPNKIFRITAAVIFILPAIGAVILLIIPPVGIFTAAPAILWYCYIFPRISKKAEQGAAANP